MSVASIIDPVTGKILEVYLPPIPPVTGTPTLNDVLQAGNTTDGLTIDASTSDILADELQVVKVKALTLGIDPEIEVENSLLVADTRSVKFATDTLISNTTGVVRIDTVNATAGVPELEVLAFNPATQEVTFQSGREIIVDADVTNIEVSKLNTYVESGTGELYAYRPPYIDVPQVRTLPTFAGATIAVTDEATLASALATAVAGDIVEIQNDITVTALQTISTGILLTAVTPTLKITADAALTTTISIAIPSNDACLIQNITIENVSTSSVATCVGLTTPVNEECYFDSVSFLTNEFAVVSNNGAIQVTNCSFSFVGVPDSHRYIALTRTTGTTIISNCQFAGNGINSTDCVFTSSPASNFTNGKICILDCSSSSDVRRVLDWQGSQVLGTNLELYLVNNNFTTFNGWAIFVTNPILASFSKIVAYDNTEVVVGSGSKGLIGIDTLVPGSGVLPPLLGEPIFYFVDNTVGSLRTDYSDWTFQQDGGIAYNTANTQAPPGLKKYSPGLVALSGSGGGGGGDLSQTLTLGNDATGQSIVGLNNLDMAGNLTMTQAGTEKLLMVGANSRIGIGVGATSGVAQNCNPGTFGISLGSHTALQSAGANCISIGNDAGNVTQGERAVAIGIGAGNTSQGVSAVAIGDLCGFTNQGQRGVGVGFQSGAINQGLNSIAIGTQAGRQDQLANSIAIGFDAGALTQGTQSIGIGLAAGQTNQGENAIAIGRETAQNGQGERAVAIGNLAGKTTQGLEAIAIGDSAGNSAQSAQAVAIGKQAGQNNQGISVAIGFQTGFEDQQSNAVAIGSISGQFRQGNGSVAIGIGAGQTDQQGASIAIGQEAGNNNQGTRSFAAGIVAGRNNQGNDSVAIGNSAGVSNQGTNSCSIGPSCGQNFQGNEATAIGFLSATETQGNRATAIGPEAGQIRQGTRSVAIGDSAGNFEQGIDSLAMGTGAGLNLQKNNAVAIGNAAGNQTQGVNSVAIGNLAGNVNQGDNCVAIGNQAGRENQHARTIVLNARATALNTNASDRFFVKPLRGVAHGLGVGVMKYDEVTAEITFSTN